MSDSSVVRHADTVLRVALGMSAETAQLPGAAIGGSWRRCVRDYSLDPVRVYAPSVVSGTALKDRQVQHEQLIQVASAEMDALYAQIAGSGYALLLTDATGIILCERVDPTLKRMFGSAGLIVGADWSEVHEGTNGIGTCIRENRPVMVHRTEHFRAQHIGLSCSGAPIHDPSGALLAVLDASTVDARDTRTSQAHTMALVTLSARLIEKCLVLQHHQHSAARSARKVTRSPERRALTLDDIAGEDPQLMRTVQRAARVASSGLSLLIQGPTGSGKECFARALHAASDRADRPFVAVNCAALPETLIESELFGYAPGAFTGARKDGRKGKIALSSGGTLFLDEIGDMPLALQTRLLRVLEEGEVTPLGSDNSLGVDLRVMCASHRPLKDLIARGGFREDLYYRLNGLTFELPALAARADKHALISRIVKAEGGNIEPSALARLRQHSWPGNLRELNNVIRGALAVSAGRFIRLDDLPEDLVGVEASPAQGPSEASSGEREALLAAIRLNEGNLVQAARSLGISRNTLYRRLRRYDIVLTRTVEK